MQKVGKKSMTEKTLMTLLIVIVVALLVSFLVIRIYDFMISKVDVEGCRLSVLAASEARFAGETTLTLQCPRNIITLFSDQYTVNGKEKKYDSKDYTNNVQHVFAEEMRECWSKMGEGYLNVFEEEFLHNQNGCLICSHIAFENPLFDTLGPLSDYITETKIPAQATVLEDVTYYNYMNRNWNQKAFSESSVMTTILQILGVPLGTKTLQTNILLENQGIIDTAKEYYILLLGVKKGAFEFYEDDTYFIVVGNTKTLTDPKTRFCTYLYS